MKPLTGDQQLRSVSLSYCVALQALNQNPLHEEEGAWMQAPIEVSRRGVGEVFSLDILSHRMSAVGLVNVVFSRKVISVTGQAFLAVVGDTFFRGRFVVRIVATGAGHGVSRFPFAYALHSEPRPG